MVTLSVDHATDFETIKIFHTTYIKLYFTMLSESPETSDSSINQPINKIYKSVQSLGKSEAHRLL